MGKTFRGSQRDQFKGRHQSKNNNKNSKKSWKEQKPNDDDTGNSEDYRSNKFN